MMIIIVNLIKLNDFTKNDIYNLLNQKENNTKEQILSIKNSNSILKFFNHKYTEIIIIIIFFLLIFVF